MSRCHMERNDAIKNAMAMLETLIDSAPFHDKAAYLMARRKCPELVTQESNPIDFLRRENSNAVAAAKRLLSYWTARVAIFQEGAFLPMDASGTGALEQGEIALVRTGSLRRLPNDNQGRGVLFYNQSLNVQLSDESRLRVAFYFFHVMADNIQNQTVGVTVLLKSQGSYRFDGITTQIAKLYLDSMLIRVRRVHFFCQVSSTATLIINSTLAKVATAVFRLLGLRRLYDVVSIHVGLSNEEIVSVLTGDGLDRAGIPTSLGGEWELSLPFHGRGASAARMPELDGVLKADDVDDQNDQIYGLDENTSTMQSALARLHEAVMLLPKGDTTALREAMQRCPELVLTESDPLRFLRFHRWDYWATARRLANYWKTRVECFQQQAFCPLSLIDNRCPLSATERDIIDRRLYSLLPPTSNGTPVIFYRKTPESRIALLDNAHQHHRLVFFLLDKMARTDVPSPLGFTSIVYLDIRALNSVISSTSANALTDMLSNAFPLIVQAVHFVLPTPFAFARSLLQSYVPVALRRMGPYFRDRVKFHVDPSLIEIARSLESCGMIRNNLPPCLGGTWDSGGIAYIMELEAAEKAKIMVDKHFELRLPFLEGEISVSGDLTSDGVGSQSVDSPASSGENRHDRIDSFAISTNSLPIAALQSMVQQSNHRHAATLEALARLARLKALSTSAQRIVPIPSAAALQAWTIPQLQPVFPTQCPQPQTTTTLTFNIQDSSPAARSTWRSGIVSTVFSPVGHPPTHASLVSSAAPTSMREAMNQLSVGERESYEEALLHDCLVIEREANEARFLRLEDFNYLNAARRLASYWDVRKDIFGDRAFLPLNQTGDGALTKDDIVLLSAAPYVLLPHMQQGGSAIFEDRSRALEGSHGSNEAMLRCLFYLISVLMEDDACIQEGLVLLFLIVTPRVPPFQPQLFVMVLQMVRSAMPIHLKAIHLLCHLPKGSRKLEAEKISSDAECVAREAFQDLVHLHSVTSVEESCKLLEEAGFMASNLPASLGGSWKYEEFAKWQKQRLRHERDMIAISGPLCSPSATAQTTAKADSEGTPLDDWSHERTRKDRKRLLNVIHSRQKRERRRAEAEALQQQCDQLRQVNSNLKADNERLDALMQAALDEVSRAKRRKAHDASEDDGSQKPSVVSSGMKPSPNI